MSNGNFDEIIENAMKKKNVGELKSYLDESLSQEQNQQLHSLLNDKKALDSLLSTPEAQNIFKKLMGDKNG